MKYYLILLLLIAFPLASASIPNLGTFKQYSCVNLLQTCSDCTYNNISSVTQPDGMKVVGEVIMFRQGTEYNYTFCNTTKLGNYIVNGHGNAGSADTVWNYNFEITPSGGPEDNTKIFLIFIISSAVLLIISFIFNNYIFSIISGFGFMAAGVYTMIYGFGDITSTYTRMLAVIVAGLGMIISVVSSLELSNEINSSSPNNQNMEED